MENSNENSSAHHSTLLTDENIISTPIASINFDQLNSLLKNLITKDPIRCHEHIRSLYIESLQEYGKTDTDKKKYLTEIIHLLQYYYKAVQVDDEKNEHKKSDRLKQICKNLLAEMVEEQDIIKEAKKEKYAFEFGLKKFEADSTRSYSVPAKLENKLQEKRDSEELRKKAIAAFIELKAPELDQHLQSFKRQNIHKYNILTTELYIHAMRNYAVIDRSHIKKLQSVIKILKKHGSTEERALEYLKDGKRKGQISSEAIEVFRQGAKKYNSVIKALSSRGHFSKSTSSSDGGSVRNPKSQHTSSSYSNALRPRELP